MMIPKAKAYGQATKTIGVTGESASEIVVEDNVFPDLESGEVCDVVLAAPGHYRKDDPAEYETAVIDGVTEVTGGCELSVAERGAEGVQREWPGGTVIACFGTARGWNEMRDEVYKTNADLQAHKEEETWGVHGASAQNLEGKIVQRDSGGRFQITGPISEDHAATKQYVDDNLADKASEEYVDDALKDKATEEYVDDAVEDLVEESKFEDHKADESIGVHGATPLNVMNKICQRDSGGRVLITAPVTSEQATNKQYVDDSLAGKATEQYVDDAVADKATEQYVDSAVDGKADESDLQSHKNDTGPHSSTAAATGNRIARRTSTGRCSFAGPTVSSHAATKGYVDGEVAGKATEGYVDNAVAGKADESDLQDHKDDQTLGTHGGTPLNQGNRIVQRDTAGRFNVADPTSSAHAANKGYVDDRFDDGSHWNNGDYIELGGRILYCWKKIRLYYNAAATLDRTWTFPRSFSSAPNVQATLIEMDSNPNVAQVSTLRVTDVTSSEAYIQLVRARGEDSFQSGDTAEVYVFAVGEA